MRLVTVGCSGSFAGPESPASSYLVQVPAAEAAAAGFEARDWNVVLDLGNGSLGTLQRFVDPLDLDAVALSHLHPDHFVDVCGLYVYLRYHPERGSTRTGVPSRLTVLGPSGTAGRLEAAYGAEPGDAMAEELDVRAWEAGVPVQVGPLTLEPYRVFHPVEAYGVRVTGPSSLRTGERAVLAYTGDTDVCDGVVELARDADLLLSEAAFHEGRDDGVEPGIHLTGRRAGEVATAAGAHRLVLTHLPAWNDPERSRTEARESYAGRVDVATTGAVFDL
ncbi:MBL fold metallo-hydrolase [Cellulosimicrobium protaetiae]|uniref:MBL fold metallo-hydrolase n=1 Tax=Cellulosimicrobium protaetiae TaxID=2587808 RepID=A0A6M5UJI2_9MICO|nr:MBL fold metallo-hydrolase [Cellulosimicrobium protaetiae]QJW37238.1 MBL fold metallo-hydrolase [Cellulosimicrobium protaetiae]